MNVITYCRVSTKEQAETGYSLEVQERICRDYAERNGYNILKVFVEKGESAKTVNRSQLTKLLEFVSKNRKNINALVVYKLDRLSRNLVDYTNLTCYFSKAGVDIKSATENIDDTPAGKFTKNMIASVAQFENDVKSERTKSGMQQAVKEGRWCWHAPIGYKNSEDSLSKPLLIPSEESRFIIEAFDLAESGLHKQTEIVARLKKKGFNRITNGLLNRVLRNSLYTGLIKVDWFPEPIEAVHKPIISRNTFFKVQLLLNGKKRSITPKLRNHPDFPLRNFIRCPKCGQKLTGGWSTGRKKVRYPYYHCFSKGCSLNLKKKVLETKFYEYLKTFQPKEDMLNLFEATVMDVWETKQGDNFDEKMRLEKELNELIKTKDRVEVLMIKGTFNDETYKRRAEAVSNEIMVKQIELNEAKIELNDIEGCLNFAKYFLSNVADLWVNADLSMKQRFQTLIFPDKIYYEEETFRTTATALIFKQLQQKDTPESCLVAGIGFEPMTFGL